MNFFPSQVNISSVKKVLVNDAFLVNHTKVIQQVCFVASLTFILFTGFTQVSHFATAMCMRKDFCLSRQL